MNLSLIDEDRQGQQAKRCTFAAPNICGCFCLSSATFENLGNHDNRLDKTEKLKLRSHAVQNCDSNIWVRWRGV
jgi:hypothetical protein